MLGNDFDTPIMYQDLANYTMSPMSPIGFGMNPAMGVGPMGTIGTGGYNTSYLGGIQVKPQPDKDSVEIMNRKNQECYSTLKKVALTAGALFLLGFIPYFGKQIKKSGGIISYIKNLWKKPQPKISRWQKFKNSAGNSWQKFKSSAGNNWQKFKNLFKNKKTTP